MKSVKSLSDINFLFPKVHTEEDYFLLTKREIEMLMDGTIVFDNGQLKHINEIPVKNTSSVSNGSKEELMCELEELIERVYYSTHNDKTINEYRINVNLMFKAYVSLIAAGIFPTQWETALFIQEQYWNRFRGWTITYLRLMVAIMENDDVKFKLNTPIGDSK